MAVESLDVLGCCIGFLIPAMQRCSPIIAIFAALAFLLSWGTGAEANECDLLKANAPTIVWPPLQDATYSPYGYNYPYVLYVPEKVRFPYLIVKSNSPGEAGLSASVLLQKAIAQVSNVDGSLGRSLADRLGAPLLMPAFPRPFSQDQRSDVYTHSLSREAMLVVSGPLYRVDLQLIAMAEEAKTKLECCCGLKLAEKIMIVGFSASGMFANRFVFLHPGLVAGAAFGGVCGVLSFPACPAQGTQSELSARNFGLRPFYRAPIRKGGLRRCSTVRVHRKQGRRSGKGLRKVS